jgi:hypothetical protein
MDPLTDEPALVAALPFEPRQVLLFAGHRVDAPGRAVPRFPAAIVHRAAAAIENALDTLGAGPGDAAFVQGAGGGDLLFAEACAVRGVRVQLLLPLPEPDFIEQSLLGSAGSEDWRARYLDLKARLDDAPRVLPDGPVAHPPRDDVFERCNQWLLDSALAPGVEKLRFICLWDGAGGDGPGGTAHMVRELTRHHGRILWIDTRQLVGGAPSGAP